MGCAGDGGVMIGGGNGPCTGGKMIGGAIGATTGGKMIGGAIGASGGTGVTVRSNSVASPLSYDLLSFAI